MRVNSKPALSLFSIFTQFDVREVCATAFILVRVIAPSMPLKMVNSFHTFSHFIFFLSFYWILGRQSSPFKMRPNQALLDDSILENSAQRSFPFIQIKCLFVFIINIKYTDSHKKTHPKTAFTTRNKFAASVLKKCSSTRSLVAPQVNRGAENNQLTEHQLLNSIRRQTSSRGGHKPGQL